MRGLVVEKTATRSGRCAGDIVAAKRNKQAAKLGAVFQGHADHFESGLMGATNRTMACMLIERRPAGILSVASVPTASWMSPLSKPPSRLRTLIVEEYFPRAEVITAGTVRGNRIRR